MSVGVGGGGNYISDGALLTWLANQQDRIYGDLRESMDIAEKRAEMANDLTDIKMHMEEANKSQDFGQVDRELQAFVAKYGADPEFAELAAGVGEIANTVHQNWEYARQGYDVAKTQYDEDRRTYEAAVDAAERAATQGGLQDSAIKDRKPEPPPEPTLGYSDEQLKTWFSAIDGKLDVSSKNDQLTMIHIQELKGTLDQGMQLGSTLIAGSDKTLNAIINNIA